MAMVLAKRTKTSSTLSGWSELPVMLVGMITKKLEGDSLAIIHARSVCTSWRSKFAFPANMLRRCYSLPSFPEKRGLCIVEKLPLFLFRVHSLPIAALAPCELVMGRVAQEVWEDHMELAKYPLEQCSVRVEVPKFGPELMKKLTSQIIPLGDHYKMGRCGWDFDGYKGQAFIRLNKEGERDAFVVLVNYSDGLLALTSSEMKWKPLANVPDDSCTNLVTFRGKFYATYLHGTFLTINPYSLAVKHLMPALGTKNHLVPCGDDELYLVEKIMSDYTPFRVSRLHKNMWVEVQDIGNRVLFINRRLGNVCFPAKDIPDDCGLTGNSLLFTDEANVTYFYKFEIRGDARGWRSTREHRVTIPPSSSVLFLTVV